MSPTSYAARAALRSRLAPLERLRISAMVARFGSALKYCFGAGALLSGAKCEVRRDIRREWGLRTSSFGRCCGVCYRVRPSVLLSHPPLFSLLG